MAPSWLEKFIVREDASPDPVRTSSSSKATLKLQYASLSDHKRTLTPEGSQTPLYEITRKSVLGAWGSKCLITAPSDNDKEVAVIAFHTFSYEIKFAARNNHCISMSYGKRTFTASGGGDGGKLGALAWKGTGMEVAGEASWELRDESSLVMVVSVDQNQANGCVELWKAGLDPQMVEELVVVGVAQIEEYKRMLRNSKKAGVGAAVSGGAVVGANVA
jgi:hypothetical protein